MESYKEIAEMLCKKDHTLKQAILSVASEIKPSFSTDIYYSLLNSIVSQQLAVKAAKAIWHRFIELFPSGYPEAKSILALDESILRSCGLSRSKLNYIKNVAIFSIENNISFEYLNTLSDNEIINYLTQIKGVGKWTVQMILMFPMDRPNVFPIDDLGIQNKMKYWYAIDAEKVALKQKLLEISDSWSPYKTLACKYLWQSQLVGK